MFQIIEAITSDEYVAATTSASDVLEMAGCMRLAFGINDRQKLLRYFSRFFVITRTTEAMQQ